MPKTKDALSRYQTIDHELRRWRPLSTKQLATKCSEVLGKRVSMRTIQQDLDDMKFDTALNLNALIKYDKRKKAHYYDRGTAPLIFPAIELNEEEMYALLFYTKATSHFKNYKIFSEMLKAIDKVLDATNISEDLRRAFSKEAILETESPLPSRGVEMLKELVLAVRERRLIEFTYKKFGDELVRRRRMKPLLIKESQELWYVIGMLDTRPYPITFAVDRMSDLIVTEDIFEEIAFNSEDHFRYSFGITALNADPVDVILSFSKEQGNYLKVVPIHHTQQVLVESNDEYRIQIKIKPSIEFYKRILGYGHGVKVISPQAVSDQITSTLRAALKNY